MKKKNKNLIYSLCLMNIVIMFSNVYAFGQESSVTITDIDGNVYHTVYRDGTNIPNMTDNTSWATLSTPGYCWYKNDATYKNTYGALYNWYTVITGKLCPIGWHVPSFAEWTTLTNYLESENISDVKLKGGAGTFLLKLGLLGRMDIISWQSDTASMVIKPSYGDAVCDKLKEVGTTHWDSPNTSATNKSGFTALPGGFRYRTGAFKHIGSTGYWWSSTEVNTANGWIRVMFDIGRNVSISSNHNVLGCSVRCIRD